MLAWCLFQSVICSENIQLKEACSNFLGKYDRVVLLFQLALSKQASMHQWTEMEICLLNRFIRERNRARDTPDTSLSSNVPGYQAMIHFFWLSSGLTWELNSQGAFTQHGLHLIFKWDRFVTSMAVWTGKTMNLAPFSSYPSPFCMWYWNPIHGDETSFWTGRLQFMHLLHWIQLHILHKFVLSGRKGGGWRWSRISLVREWGNQPRYKRDLKWTHP